MTTIDSMYVLIGEFLGILLDLNILDEEEYLDVWLDIDFNWIEKRKDTYEKKTIT